MTVEIDAGVLEALEQEYEHTGTGGAGHNLSESLLEAIHEYRTRTPPMSWRRIQGALRRAGIRHCRDTLSYEYEMWMRENGPGDDAQQ